MQGTSFGRYLLVELLGRGGMGEVWRAHDTRTNRIVAIKVLPAELSDDATYQQRFRREAQAVTRLENPHVVPIHDYGEIDGRLYVDMRLIRGRDLHAVLADGPLPPGRAVRIIEQVAKALHAAHKVGLVHRDVKPSNILVDDEDYAYLIDFGIARAINDTHLTGTGNAIGTFQYMAPERMGGHPDDARADIYALACVLYECLTGQPPFAGTDMASLIVAHLNTPPPQPSSAKPDVPVPLDAVIATGMAKEPEQRYATTVELAVAAHDAITPSGEANTRIAAPPRAAWGSPNAPPTAWYQPPPAVPIGANYVATQHAPISNWSDAGRVAAVPPTLAGPPPSQGLSNAAKWAIGLAVVAVLAIVIGGFSVTTYLSSRDSNVATSSSTTASSSLVRATTSESPTATATPPPPPLSLVGTWTGKSSNNEDVVLTINAPDRLDGKAKYSRGSQSCTETWTEVGRTGGTIHVQERGGGISGCGDVNWDVRVDGNSLTAKSTWRSGGGASNSLTLTKPL